MPPILRLYRRVTRLPLGDRIFSFAFARKAPYFATIRPRFTVLEPNHVELVIPKRRAVHNHIGTVHAIALCNGLEAAMGALAEATIPPHKRWIPKGMEVAYSGQGRQRHHLRGRDRPVPVERGRPRPAGPGAWDPRRRDRRDRGGHPAVGHRACGIIGSDTPAPSTQGAS